MALCPCPSRAREGVAAEDARRSERLTGSRRARRPQPGNAGVEGRVSDRPTVWRMPPWHPPAHARTKKRAPERQPSRASDFGMLTEPSSELPWHYPSRAPNSQSISRAKQRVPAAKNRQFCPAVVKTNDSSQPQGQNTRLFALPESPYANNRQKRPFLTSETAKNRLF